MSCIIRILTGAIQDADNNAYTRVVRIYAFFGCASLFVSLIKFVYNGVAKRDLRKECLSKNACRDLRR
jgi:hypothetical protein